MENNFENSIKKALSDSQYTDEQVADILSKLRTVGQQFAKDNSPKMDSNFWQNVVAEAKQLATEYFKAKYSHDATGQWIFLLLVIILVGSVTLLSGFNKITAEATSTLIASIIGYAIGRLQQKINNKPNE